MKLTPRPLSSSTDATAGTSLETTTIDYLLEEGEADKRMNTTADALGLLVGVQSVHAAPRDG